jgi:hypothetical protein
MTLLNALAEAFAEATTYAQVKGGAKDRLALRDAIYRQLKQQYEREARKQHKALGGDGKFVLDAQWKQKELMQKARVMADAVTKTTRERLEKIEQLPKEQQAAARAATLQHKATQLDDLVKSEGRFQASVDMLAHSGIADVKKARVMYFRTLGTEPGRSPCGVCMAVAAGNPYTVEKATSLGAKQHPNCIDVWEAEWQADPDLRKNTRRQVRDGEVTLWGGQSKTPAKGKVAERQAKMKRAEGGWKGVRREQDKIIKRQARRS